MILRTLALLAPLVTPAEPLPWQVTMGFELADYTYSIDEACEKEADKRAPHEWRDVMAAWCIAHANHVRHLAGPAYSQIDRSYIRDRDRPYAWRDYLEVLERGVIDPDRCEHHRVIAARHPHKCRDLRMHWRRQYVPLDDGIANAWAGQSHDYERFGRRGPANYSASAYRFLPGCWPPEALDRNDVAAAVTIEHAKLVCQRSKRCDRKALVWGIYWSEGYGIELDP